ncbi:cysteine--tRNA ligase [Pelagibaculum spongiae]|uniref:Cysteine--tRNA ligase n=1 Tax=Pelagibaculum spongiae TaxID=2080658 RepID=A0A2V1GZH4_9GAMM|nr:cysteine--tRNA ligase [Pelagibaculum spongiae]PVZ70354.1 cysteine--tRNA ligase [Pelagibaculum spongiae]
MQQKSIDQYESESFKPQSQLQFFDSWQRAIIPFQPLDPAKIGLYACGPTVYDYAHLGNLRTYIFVDILRRTLKLNGYQIHHVMNITDVGHLVSDADSGEDKMEKGARKHNKSAWQIAEYFENKFLSDLAELNIETPETICRATEHIQQQIEFVQQLQDKGFTYQTSDGVYFDSSKLKDYGQLARLDIAGLKSGVRVEAAEKRSITDFALWKFSRGEQRQMEWPSPWGIGFPGWHIECSAMSEHYLGKQFDIHAGGEDHIPVHHTNEIAQSQAKNGHRQASYWMHGYFLQLDQQKISKSGTSLLLSELVQRGFSPLAYRYLVLTSHYRSHLNFSWQSLQQASDRMIKLKTKVSAWPEDGQVDRYFWNKFTEKINNDLAMPQAMAVLSEMIASEIADENKRATLQQMERVLGLDLLKADQVSSEIPLQVITLAEQRWQARKQKNWLEADRLRELILQAGYQMQDQDKGFKLEKTKLSKVTVY